MAKGKPTPASFKPGDPRASAAGKKSSRALPPDIKEARAMRVVEFEAIIYKYMDCNMAQLKVFASDPNTPAKDLIVLKMMQLGLQNGDIARVEFLLQRSVGKIPDKMEVDRAGSFDKLHDAIMADLEKDDKS
jgi:hypothetical protein